MKKTIQDLAYLVKKAHESKTEPKPIVFLGAGVSVSGDIPLASGIIKQILKDHKDKPAIKNLPKKEKNNYYELMSALNAKERRELFQNYIKKAKVNIAHIYLAQLVKLGYIDYVLTVNFDDLLLRACGLYNYTMPTYDISNVNNFTTTTYQKGSIIYLHGQHYGEWLLNAKGELDKDNGRVSKLLNKISHNRTWIVVGYSGDDNVFDQINEFSNFENDLYWINYLDHKPSDKVQQNLLGNKTKNAHLISGYDADTFFLDLHAKLNIETPKIIDKPFTFLQSMIKEVNVPDSSKVVEKHKELYNGLSERMDIATNWVNQAIANIQEKDSVEKFKQDIIEAYTKEDFSKEKLFLEKIKQKEFKSAKEDLADFYFVWANTLLKSARLSTNKSLFSQSFIKYKKAIDLNPKKYSTYNNYGNAISNLAKIKSDKSLFKQSFLQFKKAIDLNPENDVIYYNYGNALSDLAKIKSDELLFKQSFLQYKKAIELNPKNDTAYYNYGNALSDLAKIKSDESLFKQSFLQFEKAINLNPKNDAAYNNYGTALSDLAEIKSDELLFKQSFLQYKKAINLNPENDSAYNNYGTALSDLAEINKDASLFKRSFIQYEKAITLNPNDNDTYYNYGNALYGLAKINKDKSLFEKSKKVLKKGYNLGGSPYNLSCFYALTNDKKNALKYLEESLKNKTIEKEFVLEDKDWKAYLKDKDFISLLEKYN